VRTEMSSRREDRRRTEQRLAASKNFDRMTAVEIVRLMNREDRKVAAAVARKLPAIARAVDAIVAAMRRGGRLIYAGAGSSGRMAVLDAAECPPTFGISKKKMMALIAGGRRAVTGAVEGAEDSAANGARDLRRLKLGRNDVVVGIAASGTTPYVLGAMRFARERGALTVAVMANRDTPLARLAKMVIGVEVGAEVLTGSTRLKAGTSQKMVLNMLSTAPKKRYKGKRASAALFSFAMRSSSRDSRDELLFFDAIPQIPPGIPHRFIGLRVAFVIGRANSHPVLPG